MRPLILVDTADPIPEGGDDGAFQSDAKAEGDANPTLPPREQS